jgi:large subunit ribosomal protein L29
MDAEKIRNLTADELLDQQRDLNDQLFRLKFQLKMGQTESLKKIRGLRKDVARMMTIRRERELEAAGRSPVHGSAKPVPAVVSDAPAPKAAAAKTAAKPAKAKKAAPKKAVVKKAAAKSKPRKK